MFSERFLAAVQAAPYALFEQHGELPAEPERFASFDVAASRVAQLRGTATLTAVAGSFVWGGKPDQERLALILTIKPAGSQAARRFTLTTSGETADQLQAALNRRKTGRLF